MVRDRRDDVDVESSRVAILRIEHVDAAGLQILHGIVAVHGFVEVERRRNGDEIEEPQEGRQRQIASSACSGRQIEKGRGTGAGGRMGG